jgi:deoxyribodipyrimidine photo-lyase
MTDVPLDRLDFLPTRAAGLARLHAFAPRAGRWYANHGGLDHGPERRSNTAGLSPWLTCRLLTPEEALAAVEAEHGPAASAAFRAEVETPLRRRAWLAERPGVWREHRLRVEGLFRTMTKSATLLAAYEEAVEGRTGIDAFDAWSKELATVGWLHPAALRAFASLWIFSLRLPWELGADLHHRSALDGEAAGLVLWREVAGLQKGVPHYAVQVDEITTVSGGRFHPKRRLVEEQARALTASPARADQPASADAAPSIPGRPGAAGLLITDADLSRSPEGTAAEAVAGLSTGPHRSPFGCTPNLIRWLDGAVEDALARVERPCERLDDTDWGLSLRAWAGRRDLATVIVAAPPPGPAADRLAAARRKLADLELRLLD